MGDRVKDKFSLKLEFLPDDVIWDKNQNLVRFWVHNGQRETFFVQSNNTVCAPSRVNELLRAYCIVFSCHTKM